MSGLKDSAVIDWLLMGDVSVQYQTFRDLLHQERPDLRTQIAGKGWGARLLAARKADGSWGEGFYQPKWTCSHYTLLDLKNLGIGPDNKLITQSIHAVIKTEKHPDGGIGPGKSLQMSDVCVNGMFLGYASYFSEPEPNLHSIVDFLLNEKMRDGGFNCRSNRRGAHHSSLHSTISVLEGIAEYCRGGYKYRVDELKTAADAAREFILQHHFYISDRTGETITPEFLKLSYPSRWKYNVLRALDHFRDVDQPWDSRMQEAIRIIQGKRRSDRRWYLPSALPGKVHFHMEEVGKPSRWITLLALRVLEKYPVHQIATRAAIGQLH
jgi:hypothetical protein